MERRLGRGLGSLLGQTAEETSGAESDDSSNDASSASSGAKSKRPSKSAAKAASGASSGSSAGSEPSEDDRADSSSDAIGRKIDVDAIRRNPDQPRKVFDSGALEELRRSIEQHGVLQPICVRRVGSSYEIISGERRWRAARSANLASIPAVVRDDVDEDVSLELAIVENVQRQDLDAMEKARGYHALMERVGLTQEQVAERLGISRSSVANQLRLLDLPKDAQEAISHGMISMGHAKVLLGLKGKKAILKALGDVVRGDLSVRETERLAKGGGSATAAATSATENTPPAPWVGEIETRLRHALGVKVTLRNGSRFKGSITLDYSGREELERLCDQIAPKDEI